MENIRGAIPVLFAEPLIKSFSIPLGQELGFLLAQIGLHGEVGFWKIECWFIVHLILDPNSLTHPNVYDFPIVTSWINLVKKADRGEIPSPESH